jgi:hypothetical protein
MNCTESRFQISIADGARSVERRLAKPEAAGSIPAIRSAAPVAEWLRRQPSKLDMRVRVRWGDLPGGPMARRSAVNRDDAGSTPALGADARRCIPLNPMHALELDWSPPSKRHAGGPIPSGRTTSSWWNGNHLGLRSRGCGFNSRRGHNTDDRLLHERRRRRLLARSPAPQAGGAGSTRPVGRHAPAEGFGSPATNRARRRSTRLGGTGCGCGQHRRASCARARGFDSLHSHTSVVQWEGRGPTNRRRKYPDIS